MFECCLTRDVLIATRKQAIVARQSTSRTHIVSNRSELCQLNVNIRIQMSSFTSTIVGQSPTVRSLSGGLKPTIRKSFQKRSTLFHNARPALRHRAAVSVRAAAAEVSKAAAAKPISGVPEGKSAITHLECALEGDEYEAGVLHNLSKAGKPLLVRYDYEAASKTLTRESLAARPATLWKWREILPVTKTENCVYLGEEATPILDAPRAAESLGVEQAGGMLYVKDEGRLPTGSFKARGLVMAVSMAKELGVKRMAMPTNGNAGAALAAYCRHCGIEAYAFAPEDTPATNIEEMAIQVCCNYCQFTDLPRKGVGTSKQLPPWICVTSLPSISLLLCCYFPLLPESPLLPMYHQGAKVWKVNGYIDDCGKIVGGGKEEMGWFDTSTLKEPYRIEGKKTMGLELAEQFGFDDLPDGREALPPCVLPKQIACLGLMRMTTIHCLLHVCVCVCVPVCVC